MSSLVRKVAAVAALQIRSHQFDQRRTIAWGSKKTVVVPSLPNATPYAI